MKSLVLKAIEQRWAAGVLGEEFPDSYDAFREGTTHRLLIDHDPYLAHSFIEVARLDYACAWVIPVGDPDARIDIRFLEPVPGVNGAGA